MATEDQEQQRVLSLIEDGGADVLTEEESALVVEAKPEREGGFNENLAESLDEDKLNAIAKEVVQWYEWDDESRADWKEREAKGILMLGVTEKTEGGAKFKGASKVVHPLLMEACTQFQARAIGEIWPAGGPVKGVVLGESTPELEDQKDRVVGFMNYQYTTTMPGAFDTEDKLLFRLPLSGSCFTKIYHDPLLDGLVREFIDPNYFVVPYGASDLRTAPRYTHVFYESVNTVKKKQAINFYRDVELSAPYEDADAGSSTQTVRDTIDNAEGHEQVNIAEDQRHTMLEMHVDYIIPGDEDKDGEKETGIALPYIITVERGSYHVLSIYRNWREDDEKKLKRIHFSHRKFLPGLGFYGFGFLHAIGGLARAATGALRAVLDSASFANQQGGFKSKDAKLPSGDATIGPGDWLEVESTAEELSKAFYKLPYPEPSRTLHLLLGQLDDLGRRFASTTENMVGEASNTGPVGTTVALIEQGMKLFSSIHKRQHNALGEEFKIVADLDKHSLDGEYPYKVPGEDRTIKAEDFDDRVDIIPVSDPNMVSSTQRIATAQAVLQLASESPDLYDRKEANQRMLEALRVENIEKLLMDKTIKQRIGPVEENIMMTMGSPVKAFLEQDHAAHLVIHESWFNSLPPDMQEQQAQAHQSHRAEHIAQAYLLQVQQQVGGELPAIMMFSSEYEEEQELPELPPDVENAVAMRVAQASQEAQQQAQEQAQAQEQKMLEAEQTEKDKPKMVEVGAEQARKDVVAGKEQERKDAELAREQARLDKESDRNENRKDATAHADLVRMDEEADAKKRAEAKSSE